MLKAFLARTPATYPADTAGTRTGRRLGWAWGAMLCCLAVIVLWFLYLHLSRSQRVESDGASNALQAWDMLHGNLLLRGWTVEDVSFYTTELPEYLLIEAARGLNPDVLHVAASLSYALIVVLAALLAKGRAAGREGVVRMLIAAGILVAPQPGAGVFIVLFQPDHMGTQAPLLLTWLVLDRLTPGEGTSVRWWLAPLLTGLLFAWIGIADQIVLYLGVIPLVLVCACRAARRWRRGQDWRRWLAAARSELALAAAAIASYPVMTGVVTVIAAAGGYRVLPVSPGITTVGKLPMHLRLAGDGVLGLYGASFQGPPHGLALAFALLHLAGVALAGAGLLLGIRGWFRGDDLIAQVLVLSILVNVGAYLLSSRPAGYWSVRELAGILPAGAVLAGRLTGPWLAGGAAGRWRAALRTVLAVIAAGYLAALGYGATRPAQPGVGQDLAGWLAAHGLRYGLAHYGLANATTLASGGSVALRTVAQAPSGRLAPGPHEFNLTWYDPRRHDASFVVVLARPAPLDPMTPAQVTGTFGAPAHEYLYHGYLIMTWDKNLLTELAPPVRYVGITPDA